MTETPGGGPIPKWQNEHRDRLAAQGIELPDERAEEPTPSPIHCRRCHRDIPADEHPKHYRECPGFASKCEEWNCSAKQGYAAV